MFSCEYCELRTAFYRTPPVTATVFSQKKKAVLKMLDWIRLDWNALFRVDKIVEKKNNNECLIQVLAYINR